jgi:hypothetical protein
MAAGKSCRPVDAIATPFFCDKHGDRRTTNRNLRANRARTLRFALMPSHFSVRYQVQLGARGVNPQKFVRPSRAN